MPGKPNQKLKLLYLAELFHRKTDPTHSISTSAILDYLAERGITAERKSIYSDIEVLREFGMPIERGICVRDGYRMARTRFDTLELMMLVDAVQASPVLTHRQSERLVEKLAELACDHQAELIRRQLYGTGFSSETGRKLLQSRTKTDSEVLFNTIGTIHRAIAEGKKISFIYVHRMLVNNIPVYDTGREFVISPYALVWNQDKYYVVGNYGKYNDLSHYRVDRINHVICTAEAARPIDEVSDYRGGIDTADYMRRVFNMFAGSHSIVVELECDMKLFDAVTERFGINIPYRQISNDRFSVRTGVIFSEGFIRWLLGYAGGIVVVSPDSVRREIAKRLAEMLGQYGQ